MRYDRELVRAVNTTMLNQVGPPPPKGVLAAVLTLCGGKEPRLISVVAEWREEQYSTWRVIGCTDRILFRVVATKACRNWSGTTGDDDRIEDIDATAWRLADIESVSLAAANGEWLFMNEGRLGESRASECVWQFTFGDGAVLTLDPADGPHANSVNVEDIAAHAYEAWIGQGS